MNSSLLQSAWRESSRRVNGVDLHVVEAGENSDPLIILLHGFPEFWWAWRKQITPLAEQGYHVVVPDMRGYNTSDRPRDVSDYTVDVLAGDVSALAEIYGAEQYHLVGHDWGAVIGWWVAARDPSRLSRAALIAGPHPDVWSKQSLMHPTQALRSAYIAAFQLPWLPEATLGAFDFAALKGMMQGSALEDTFEPGAFDHYAQAWAQSGSLTGMLNYYRALRERKTSQEPARLKPPILVLWSDQDRLLERHIMQASFDLCDDGRFVVVDGASHWPHLDQPVRVLDEITRFFSAHLDAHSKD
jgi:pimeloyl-ACP methyl ester carboxylesterase